MKFAVPAVALLSSVALANPNPNPEPWCLQPGQGCWKTKRGVEAEKRWCLQPGQGCWKVKRAAEAFTTAVTARGLPSEADDTTGYPVIQVGDLPSFNRLASFLAHSSGDHAAFIDALAPQKRWCLQPGQGCWKEKRDEVLAEEKRWCLQPGQGCWKEKRGDQAEDGLTEEKRWCARVPEAACNAVKEAANAVLDVADEKRWCLRPGQGCWKEKRDTCDHPSLECFKANRDLETIAGYARDILANLE